jgi:hypothetical protein
MPVKKAGIIKAFPHTSYIYKVHCIYKASSKNFEGNKTFAMSLQSQFLSSVSPFVYLKALEMSKGFRMFLTFIQLLTVTWL